VSRIDEAVIPESVIQDFLGALIALSTEGRILSWSSGAELLFGYSSGEAVGQAVADLLVPPEHAAEARHWLQMTLDNGASTYEAVRLRKDGTRIHVEVIQRVVSRPDGGAAFIAVNKRDITRLKYLRDAEVLEAKFSGLLEAAPDAMVIVDADGRIVLANSRAEQLFDYAREDLLGKQIELLVPERFRSAHPSYRTGYFESPQPRPMGAGLDLYGRKRDGSEFPAEISLSPMQTEGGVLATAAIRDVTARKKTEGMFRGLLEAAPDAMVIVDDAGRVVLINTQAERMFGYTREELLGQTIETLVPARFQQLHPTHRTGYSHAPRSRPMGSGLELYGLHKNGTEFPVEISLSPLETEEGVLVTAAIRDISELREQYRRVQEANRLKSEFLANMSHELRTPLNAVIGFAEIIHDGRAGPISEEQREYLGDILTSSRHLLQIINDILDLAKIEAGRITLHPEHIDLRRVFAEVRDILRTAAAAKSMQLDTEIDSSLVDIVADPSRLKQVLYNYLSNALKFTPEYGRIVIRALPDGGEAFRIEVEDNGIGIAAEDVDRLFTEFQQLDSSVGKRFQGTGLGLALTQRIVEAQGGRVGVSSSVGEGSTFYAVMPRVTRVPPRVVDRRKTEHGR
jgi:PAS domain S-box-containing protein